MSGESGGRKRWKKMAALKAGSRSTGFENKGGYMEGIWVEGTWHRMVWISVGVILGVRSEHTYSGGVSG